MTRLESKTVSHNGITTAYYDEGEGQPLVLLHGFTGSKLDFHDQVAWFSDRYRVIVPDNRGHGESTNTDDETSYTLEALVDDLGSFIAALALQDVHLLGHSMGGRVVMRYALDHHKALASLILMDTSSAPFTMPEGMRETIQGILQQEGMPGLIKMMQGAPRTDEVQSGIDLVGEDEHWRRVKEKLDQMDRLAYPSLGMALGSAPDITASLAELSCHTTIIVGSADLPYLEVSKRMADIIPGARLAVVKGAAHCPQYENSNQWREELNIHLG